MTRPSFCKEASSSRRRRRPFECPAPPENRLGGRILAAEVPGTDDVPEFRRVMPDRAPDLNNVGSKLRHGSAGSARGTAAAAAARADRRPARARATAPRARARRRQQPAAPSHARSSDFRDRQAGASEDPKSRCAMPGRAVDPNNVGSKLRHARAGGAGHPAAAAADRAVWHPARARVATRQPMAGVLRAARARRTQALSDDRPGSRSNNSSSSRPPGKQQQRQQ